MTGTDSAIHFLIPIAGFVLNIAVQLLSVRIIPGLGVLRSVFTGFGAGVLGVLCAEILLSQGAATGDTAAMTAANLLIYGSLGYCYFHFINLGITARRIRILRELYQAGKGLTLGELLKRYNAADMIDTRLERLMGSGQIVLKDNRYHIGKPVMLFMSRTIVAMKMIVLGKRSEFD